MTQAAQTLTSPNSASEVGGIFRKALWRAPVPSARCDAVELFQGVERRQGPPKGEVNKSSWNEAQANPRDAEAKLGPNRDQLSRTRIESGQSHPGPHLAECENSAAIASILVGPDRSLVVISNAWPDFDRDAWFFTKGDPTTANFSRISTEVGRCRPTARRFRTSCDVEQSWGETFWPAMKCKPHV